MKILYKRCEHMRSFRTLAKLWVDGYGDGILRLSNERLVEIANQCIDVGLVPEMAPVEPDEGTRLAQTVKNALEEDARQRAAADQAMPMLTGSEKQVRLAEFIRKEAISNARILRQWAVRNQDEKTTLRLDACERDVLRKVSKAAWFIDHRPDYLEYLMNAEVNFRWTTPEADGPMKAEEQAVHVEKMLSPRKERVGIAEVTVTDEGQLVARLIDMNFFQVVKKYDMKLIPASLKWQRKLEDGKTASDQVARLAGELLKEGFEVLISDDAARKKAEETFVTTTSVSKTPGEP